MQSPDVNILVEAFRPGGEHHEVCRRWLDEAVNAPAPLAVVPTVLSGFVRIVTHPRIFAQPNSTEEALGFCETFVLDDVVEFLEPGPAHWTIFSTLCRSSGARGNLVPDAWLAAVMIENGCEFITLDRDFARFEGLRWSVPG